jgi:AcrR family transcriptional regulator
MATKAKPGGSLVKVRKRDSARTKNAILNAALQEYSQRGYSGARTERIAQLAKCNIRMLYQYFGNKEGLYLAVLEHAHMDIRAGESELNLQDEEPLEGVLKLLRFTFDYWTRNPQFNALLVNENLMHGKFMFRSKGIVRTALPLRDSLADLVRRGQASGVFRSGLDPIQIYVTISALSRFHHTNGYSLSALLKTNLASKAWQQKRLLHACELLKAYLMKPQNTSFADREQRTTSRVA